jgi:hypothetical protein
MVKTDEVTEQSRALDPGHQVGPAPPADYSSPGRAASFARDAVKKKPKLSTKE